MRILFLLAALSLNFLYAAEPNAGPIKVGMSTVLSGPAKNLGQEVKLGVETYFNKINAAGGINGHKIELIALDDHYEPTFAAKNMRQLIDKENVIGIIGNVGTPTAAVTVPIANEKKTLLYGAFTGAGILRKKPPDRYVINLRESYNEETKTMIQELLGMGIKPEEIAFFIQNDAYGQAGYDGAIKALKEAGFTNLENLPLGRYTRNTVNVDDGIATILESKKNVKAFIIIGAYAPVAKFIKMMKANFPKALFLNVSFVGPAPLAQELGNEDAHVIITQVVPPLDSDLPAVKEYREDFKGKQLSFGSLEGYLDAKVFVMALKGAIDKNQRGK